MNQMAEILQMTTYLSQKVVVLFIFYNFKFPIFSLWVEST